MPCSRRSRSEPPVPVALPRSLARGGEADEEIGGPSCLSAPGSPGLRQPRHWTSLLPAGLDDLLGRPRPTVEVEVQPPVESVLPVAPTAAAPMLQYHVAGKQAQEEMNVEQFSTPAPALRPADDSAVVEQTVLAVPPSQLQQQIVLIAQPQPRLHFYLAGDPLELMVAPGDLLMVQGSGRLAEIGQAGGFMGHVLIVIAVPRGVQRGSAGAKPLQDVWPSAPGVSELWCVPTVESTRREQGLHEVETVLYVDPQSRKLMIAGEVGLDGEVCSAEPEQCIVWQSPEEVRSELRVDLMQEVLKDMRASQANWSVATGLKAVFKAAGVTVGKCSIKTLEELRSCWRKPPICTSVAIAFWQRYFEKLALHSASTTTGLAAGLPFLEGERVAYWNDSCVQWMDAVVVGHNLGEHGGVVSYNLDVKCGAQPQHVRKPVTVMDASVKAMEQILKYMPLKADRALPGDLLNNLKDCGWVALPQVPRVFRPALLQGPQHRVVPVAPQPGASGVGVRPAMPRLGLSVSAASAMTAAGPQLQPLAGVALPKGDAAVVPPEPRFPAKKCTPADLANMVAALLAPSRVADKFDSLNEGLNAPVGA